MGCDYYIVTYIVINYKGSPFNGNPRVDYIEIDRTRHWFVEVPGELNMTDEEYDDCMEKYGQECDDNVVLFENGRFVDDRTQEYYTGRGGWLENVDMSSVDNVKWVQLIQDRV